MYKKYRLVTNKNTFRALARQELVSIEVFRNEHDEGIFKSASIKKFYAFVRNRINP